MGEGRTGPRCFVISITPFTAGGEVDEAAFRAHLRRMADAGLGVYVGGGGSGEGYTLTAAESTRLQEVAVEEIGARVPVRSMGVEPRTAAEMVDHVARAARAGVEAAQVYSLDVGHGHHPTGAELRRYFEEVLSSTDLPCVVSTHQSVGYRLPVDLLAGLAERFSHLSGVNCSHPDLAYLARLVDAVGSRLTVHVGGPGQALAALALGADGFLSSEANLAPHLCTAATAAHDSRDTPTMMRAFGTLLRLSALLYDHGGIRATKSALAALGLPGGRLRPPRLPIDDEAAAFVLAGLEDLDVKGWEGWR
jgi:4-hydroxy-tetrahydrodipicolinate synthase